ncbi:immunoglobulin superfamily member 23 [Pipistrellus kuhlii]|uniref:immunoglobulin superfamily member 23 n=1 Tax=Pipistrellus kuhlii TaxID=59472 RepID=UPI00174EDFC6|nr:immunoglobulin superfamily member 23 [Pipistrellus kuhlii]KAF6272570.1 immunoglobulin superfamily member 23 [Pipistrellus kuhlii]
MRRPLYTGPGRGPAWDGLLLTGTLLASCICPASSELPASAPPDTVTEGAGALLPVPRSRDGLLSTSWSRVHEAQQDSPVFSHEGLRGPGHAGRAMPGAPASPVIRNMTSYPAVLDPRRGRRSVAEQTQDKDFELLLLTFPETSLGVVRSELNFSVVLGCVPNRIAPSLLIHWTFHGQPRGTGEKLLLRRLAREHLGTYTCSARSSQGQPSAKSVDVSLPEADMGSMDEPIDPDPVLTLSGGSAIALLVAGCVGLVVVMLGIGSAIVQIQRSDRGRIQRCC